MALPPLDELTLKAYLAALPKLTEPLPPDLQTQFSTIAPQLLNEPTPEAIDVLRDLISQHPPLKALYKAERLALQSPESQRNKFLTTTITKPTQTDGKQTDQPVNPPVEGKNLREATHALFTQTLIAGLIDNSRHSADNKSLEDEAISVDQSHKLDDSKGAALPLVQRFVLRDRPTEAEQHYYKTYIAELQQLNPNWQILPDQPKPGESAAHVAIYQDAETAIRYKTYLTTRCIEDVLTDFHF